MGTAFRREIILMHQMKKERNLQILFFLFAQLSIIEFFAYRDNAFLLLQFFEETSKRIA